VGYEKESENGPTKKSTFNKNIKYSKFKVLNTWEFPLILKIRFFSHLVGKSRSWLKFSLNC
jgi:hypothetical protein